MDEFLKAKAPSGAQKAAIKEAAACDCAWLGLLFMAWVNSPYSNSPLTTAS